MQRTEHEYSIPANSKAPRAYDPLEGCMPSELSGWVALAMAMSVGLEVIPFLPIVKAILAEIRPTAILPPPEASCRCAVACLVLTRGKQLSRRIACHSSSSSSSSYLPTLLGLSIVPIRLAACPPFVFARSNHRIAAGKPSVLAAPPRLKTSCN